MSKVIDRYTPEVNLRQEMIDLSNETAYEVLIQRTSSKIRCKCFNHKFQEPDARCPICIGTGWVFKFEKHKAFKQDMIANNNGNILFTPVGKLIQGYSKFFFQYDVPITKKDYIWEVAFKNGKPIKLIAMYQVEDLSPERGLDGQIEYKLCVAKDEPFNSDFKNMYIGKAWRDV